MKAKTILILLILILAIGLAACGGSQTKSAAPETIDLATLPVDITVQQVNAIRTMPEVELIDVREQWEYDEGHLPGIKLMPMNSIPNRLDEIPKDKFVVITCHTGNRSSQVTKFLRDKGFTNVHNMLGGIAAWEKAKFPVEK